MDNPANEDAITKADHLAGFKVIQLETMWGEERHLKVLAVPWKRVQELNALAIVEAKPFDDLLVDEALGKEAKPEEFCVTGRMRIRSVVEVLAFGEPDAKKNILLSLTTTAMRASVNLAQESIAAAPASAPPKATDGAPPS